MSSRIALARADRHPVHVTKADVHSPRPVPSVVTRMRATVPMITADILLLRNASLLPADRLVALLRTFATN
jgi:hypothetical protein